MWRCKGGLRQIADGLTTRAKKWLWANVKLEMTQMMRALDEVPLELTASG
jgi:hypothetical protein